MVNRYADLLSEKSTTNDARINNVLACAQAAYGKPLADARDKDYVVVDTTSLDGIESDNGEGGSNNYQCVVTPPLSWIACPIITLVVKSLDFLEGAIVNALEVPPLTTGGAFEGLHMTWEAFRDLANVLLVFIFLITIFAQVLPFDIDPYMVKKVLPKLIAAAIFIQFSYFFVQIMFDISRILGAGVRNIIESIPVSDVGGGLFGQEIGDATGTSILGGLGAVAAGTMGAAAVFTAGSALIVPVLLLLLSALISVVTLFVTLQMRMIIIIILTIISPLAFLAWILPNTESYFKKWITGLIKLLLMYPIIVFMVEGSNLISKVSYDAVIAMSGGGGGLGGVSDISKVMISLIPIIIYFMIPMTFKWAGGIFASIAGAVQSQGGRLSKRARSGTLMKNALENLKEQSEKKLIDSKAFKLGDLRNNKGPDGSVSKVLRSGFGRLGARAATGNALSRGESGGRKIAETIKRAKARELALGTARLEELEAPNPVIGEMIAAKLSGESEYTYKDKRGNFRTVKLSDDIVSGGLKYLNDHGGHVEIASLGEGGQGYGPEITDPLTGLKSRKKGPALYDEKENGGRGGYSTEIDGYKDIAQIMAEATEGNPAALLKIAPHLVHAKGSAVYNEATAEAFSGMKKASMEVARKVIQDDKQGEANMADVILDIMNSSDKSGKIDPGVANIIKEMVEDSTHTGLGMQTIDLGDGNGAVPLSSVVNKIFTANGKIRFNDSAKRG